MSRWILQVSAGTGPAEVRAFVGRLAPALAAICRDRRMAHYRFDRGAPVRTWWLDRRGALEVQRR